MMDNNNEHDHLNDDNADVVVNNNDVDGRRYREQDQQQQQQLTTEGRTLLSILARKEELPEHVEGTINAEVNRIAGEFLSQIRTSIVDLLYEHDIEEEDLRDQRRCDQQNGPGGLIGTIVDTKNWQTIEQQYETAIRFIPEVLTQKRYGMYPIQWMALSNDDNNYNLKLVSLIPMVVRLGIELKQFDEEVRGGLLLNYEGDEEQDADGGHGDGDGDDNDNDNNNNNNNNNNDIDNDNDNDDNESANIVDAQGQVNDQDTQTRNVLQYIIHYDQRSNNCDNTNVDECFYTVMEKLRMCNHFRKEDIRRYGMVDIISCDEGCWNERIFCYLVKWDPTTLAVPVNLNFGDTRLPIHITNSYIDEVASLNEFRVKFRVGMKYYPHRFGFCFTDVTYNRSESGETDIDEQDVTITNDDGTQTVYLTESPFRAKANHMGRDVVVQTVIDCIDQYCDNTTDIGSKQTSCDSTKSSLLLSSVINDDIHLDCLYILLRHDPSAMLLMLEQRLRIDLSDHPVKPAIVSNTSSSNNASVVGSSKTAENNTMVNKSSSNHNHNPTSSSLPSAVTLGKKRKHEVIGSGDKEIY